MLPADRLVFFDVFFVIRAGLWDAWGGSAVEDRRIDGVLDGVVMGLCRRSWGEI